MDIVKRSEGHFVIFHAGQEIDMDFSTECDAWAWADRNVDDQVFDGPNCLSDPLKYRPKVAK